MSELSSVLSRRPELKKNYEGELDSGSMPPSEVPPPNAFVNTELTQKDYVAFLNSKSSITAQSVAFDAIYFDTVKLGDRDFSLNLSDKNDFARFFADQAALTDNPQQFLEEINQYLNTDNLPTSPRLHIAQEAIALAKEMPVAGPSAPEVDQATTQTTPDAARLAQELLLIQESARIREAVQEMAPSQHAQVLAEIEKLIQSETDAQKRKQLEERAMLVHQAVQEAS